MTAAFCILTKDHPDIVKEISLNFYAPLTAKGFDIYIYDSSEDDKTEKLIKAWSQAGYNNVYYVDARFTKTGDEKLVAIYMGYGLQKEYDYIWNAKDRVMYSSDFLDRIVADMSKSPDVIMAGLEEDSYFFSYKKFDDEYRNPVTFFRDFGATSTSWDSIIFNRNTMLKDIDWEKYEEKYQVGYSNPFNQPTVLFARLAEINNPYIIVERPQFYDRVFSNGTGSGWISQTVNLWGVKWPAAINRLPSIYDEYKKYIIKVETMHICVFGSHGQMMGLAMEGHLNKENFAIIKPYFHELSDIPVEYVEMMIDDKIEDLAVLLWNDYNRAYIEKDIDKIIWYHKANEWLTGTLGEDVYDDMKSYFKEYMHEQNPDKKKAYFDDINSLDEAIAKVKKYYNK